MCCLQIKNKYIITAEHYLNLNLYYSYEECKLQRYKNNLKYYIVHRYLAEISNPISTNYKFCLYEQVQQLQTVKHAIE